MLFIFLTHLIDEIYFIAFINNGVGLQVLRTLVTAFLQYELQHEMTRI